MVRSLVSRVSRFAQPGIGFLECPHDDPDIDSVWRWFEFQLSLVREELARVFRAFPPGGDILAAAPRARESQFIGLTRGEVEEFFDAQRGRLELLTMFALLATTEAILRLEFNNRVAARRKDSLSKRFREIHKVSGDKIRLDEDILAAMKEEGVAPNAIAAFRGALKLRHWLAPWQALAPKARAGLCARRCVRHCESIDRIDPSIKPECGDL
jgi:hypothetical protein